MTTYPINPPPPLCSGDLEVKWKEGAILHCATETTGGKYIRKCLTKWQKRILKDAGLDESSAKAFASHDAICTYKDYEKGIGEMSAKYGRGVWTPLEDYKNKIIHGEATCWYLWPIGATDRQGWQVANDWWSNGKGKPYDYAAFIRLFIKSTFMDVFDSAAGWKWADWCTENVADLWSKTGKDPYQTTNPTPLTSDHRAGWNWSKTGLITLEAL